MKEEKTMTVEGAKRFESVQCSGGQETKRVFRRSEAAEMKPCEAAVSGERSTGNRTATAG